MSIFETAFLVAGLALIAAIGASALLTWIAAARLNKPTDYPETQDDFTTSMARWGKVQERIDQ